MKPYLKKFNNSKEFFKIVCIGDSTTSQEWCHPNWVDWLNFTFREDTDFNNDWRRKIINSGRDGAEINHYINYFNQEVGLYKPDVVIVSIGLNHLFLKSAPEDVEKLLSPLFEKIVNINAQIICWSPYAIPNKKYINGLKKINSVYKKLAKQYNGVYLDMYSEFLKYDLSSLFTFVTKDTNVEWELNPGDIDFLHCNEIGNQIIAEQISTKAFKKELSDWEFGTMKLINTNKYLK